MTVAPPVGLAVIDLVVVPPPTPGPVVVPPPTPGPVVVPPPTPGPVVVSQSVSSSSSLVPAPPEVGLVVTVVSVVPPIPPLVVVGFPVGPSVAVSQSVSSSSSEAVEEAPAARDELAPNDVVRELLNPGLLETPATDELPGSNNELNQLPDEVGPAVVVGLAVGSSVAVSQSVSSSSSGAVEEAPAARDELPANDVLLAGSDEAPATVELPGSNNELNQLPDEVGSALDAVVVGLALPAPASVVVGTTLVFEATGLDDSSSHSSSSSPGSELEEL